MNGWFLIYQFCLRKKPNGVILCRLVPVKPMEISGLSWDCIENKIKI